MRDEGILGVLGATKMMPYAHPLGRRGGPGVGGRLGGGRMVRLDVWAHLNAYVKMIKYR